MRIISTKDRVDHFHRRTNNHIALVVKWYEKIIKHYSYYNRIDIKKHDQIKFEDPEYIPYIYLTWNYHCKDNNTEFEVSDQLQNDMNKATMHHIINSEHHPEFWDQNFDPSMFNPRNRDEVGKSIVDATEMPYRYILEMVSDWLAMSEEKKTNPYDWAEKNINKRWKFDEDQVNLIYDILNRFYKEDQND